MANLKPITDQRTQQYIINQLLANNCYKVDYQSKQPCYDPAYQDYYYASLYAVKKTSDFGYLIITPKYTQAQWQKTNQQRYQYIMDISTSIA